MPAPSLAILLPDAIQALHCHLAPPAILSQNYKSTALVSTRNEQIGNLLLLGQQFELTYGVQQKPLANVVTAHLVSVQILPVIRVNSFFWWKVTYKCMAIPINSPYYSSVIHFPIWYTLHVLQSSV